MNVGVARVLLGGEQRRLGAVGAEGVSGLRREGRGALGGSADGGLKGPRAAIKPSRGTEWAWPGP